MRGKSYSELKGRLASPLLPLLPPPPSPLPLPLLLLLLPYPLSSLARGRSPSIYPYTPSGYASRLNPP